MYASFAGKEKKKRAVAVCGISSPGEEEKKKAFSPQQHATTEKMSSVQRIKSVEIRDRVTHLLSLEANRQLHQLN